MTPTPELEATLGAVEQRLAALSAAVLRHDATAVEDEAAALHRALAIAIRQFSGAARDGGVPGAALRLRLAAVSGQVAAQRESMARATASLDRAIDVLIPGGAGGLYTAAGSGERSSGNGALPA